MSNAVYVDIETSKIEAKLDAIPPAVHDALVIAVTLDAGEVQGAAQSLASGDLLQVRTGKFVKSIKSGVKQNKNSVTGRVYSRDVRAGLFEWGGHTPPHLIEPSSKLALLFDMRGGKVFARRVNFPGGTYTARQIIHTALDEFRDTIADDLRTAALGALPDNE